MTVVDTSALMAILLKEADAAACAGVLEMEPDLVISAVTFAEALIVAGRRGLAAEMEALIERLVVEIVPLSASESRRAADAYARWGKGVHPAALNFGDCFAYALARARDCALLFVGADFRRTDIRPALAAGP